MNSNIVKIAKAKKDDWEYEQQSKEYRKSEKRKRLNKKKQRDSKRNYNED